MLIQRLEREEDPITLARRYMPGTDIVVAEGFTKHPIPKIEVYRRDAHAEPHYTSTHPSADHWFAMVTDHETTEYPFPTFQFSDTEWLVALSTLAWDKAMIIEG